MQLYRSLAFKNAIIYLIIFLTGLSIIGYILFTNSSEKIVETAENRLSHNGKLIEIQLKEYIDDLNSSIDHLTTSPLLQRYRNVPNEENYNLVAMDYLSIINSEDYFSQIRYIEAGTGKELIRVDRKNDISKIISRDDLQTKSDRAYFQEAIKLDADKIYFSQIDLNKEKGKISLPLTPTLRIAKPIYSNNESVGVVVINTDLTKLFERFRKTVGNDFLLRMVNEDGFYIMHENPDSTFLFEYLEQANQLAQVNLSTSNDLIFTNEVEIISSHRVSIPHLNYDLYYYVIANKSNLLSSYYTWRNKSIWVIFIIGGLFTFIAFTLLNNQAKTLNSLTSIMKAFPISRNTKDLPIDRNDEIGDLAKGFNEMSQIINDQIKTIEDEKIRAVNAEKQKSEFIENISHEIRNPLQSITGLSQLLAQNNPNPNQIDILNSIKLNTSNLSNLVDNILNYQNVINGNVKLNVSWNNINKLSNEIIISNQFRASEKSINITSDLDAKLDNVFIELDKLRVSQVLNNLISNAIAHTLVNGNITIATRLLSKTNSEIKILISVIDDGIGISKDYLEKINERYFTSSNSESSSSNFGLGLTIVNELLWHLKSELKVKSKLDYGSTFSFELQGGFKEELNEKTIISNTKFLKENSILLLEDDEQLLNLYKHVFEDYTVDFYNLLDDNVFNQSKKYDLIIADYHLDGGVLVDYITQLKTIMSEHASLLIISGDVVDLNELKSDFPNVIHLLKPVSMDLLLLEVRRCLITSHYGFPEFESIKKDYDFNEAKFKSAINLLSKEWCKYKNNLTASILNSDHENLEDTLHKFNTTLRRLKLFKFENRLFEIQNMMKERKDINIDLCEEVKEIMHVYLDIIHDEIN